MQKSMLLLFGLFICLFSAAAKANTDWIINENFDSSLDLNPNKWLIWQESSSSSRPFVDYQKGNPGNALNGGDKCGHMCGNYLYYNKEIHYQRGATILFDFWCTGNGWHYTDVRVGLASNRGGEPQPIVYLWANKGQGSNQINTLVNKRDADNVARYRPEMWHTGKIVILPNQFVEFYLDETLIQRSDEPLTNIERPATLFVLGRSGGGPAYIDNIKVNYVD